MITRIFLDLDDVLNTLVPHVLHSLGCAIDPTDYAQYPKRHGWAISQAANELRGGDYYSPASFWSSVKREVWATAPKSPLCDWLVDTAARLVGRENVYVATSTTDFGDCLAGKLDWIHRNLPSWTWRQYLMTPCKHLLARPDALLIDDLTANLQAWLANGGHTILVPAPWNERWPLIDRAVRVVKEEFCQIFGILTK